MKNTIDDTTEEYASDLKKKIEQAKLEKELKEKQQSENFDESSKTVSADFEHKILESEYLDKLKDIKANFENEEVEQPILETVEFDIGPEEVSEVEKTKVIDTHLNSTPRKNNEPKKDLKDEPLSPKDVKNNKIITIVIVAVLGLCLIVGGIVGIKYLRGGAKEDTIAQQEKDKKKAEEAKKNKEETKEKETEKEPEKEPETTDINDIRILGLKGQIESNTASIATIEAEISSYEADIIRFTTEITKADQYKNNLATLNQTLEDLYAEIETFEDEEDPKYLEVLNLISTSLDSMQCSSVVNEREQVRPAIDGCKVTISNDISNTFKGYTSHTLDDLTTSLYASISEREGKIETNREAIKKLEQDSETKQYELENL